MAFSFTKDLETGNVQIDAEHKQLIAAVNALLEACQQGKGRAQLESAINFLADYTKTHFAHEERLQQSCRYPRYEAHKKWHTDFIAQIQQLRDKFLAQGATLLLVGEVNGKTSLLISHIKSADLALAKYLREHEAK